MRWSKTDEFRWKAGLNHYKAAMLVGMLRSTPAFNPIVNPS
jgi:hypothetical protein